MSIATKTELTASQKIAQLRVKHQPVFDIMGIPTAVFTPKMAYRPIGKDELYVNFFVNELKREVDIYTEFVSRDYISEDSNRTLWVWKYNPHWEEEYESVPAVGTVSERYLIPVNELVKVVVPKEKISEKSFDDFSDDLLEDAPISELTIRDLAAIMTGKALSKKEWLNKLLQD